MATVLLKHVDWKPLSHSLACFVLVLVILGISGVALASEELQAQGTAALRRGDYKNAVERYMQAHCPLMGLCYRQASRL